MNTDENAEELNFDDFDDDLLEQLRGDEDAHFPPLGDVIPSFSTIVIISGLPIVEPTKSKRLFLGVVKKISAAALSIDAKSEEYKTFFVDWHMPFVEGKSRGFGFAKFQTARHANTVFGKLDGFKVPPHYFLKTFRYEDWETLKVGQSTKQLPTEEEYEAPDDLLSWLYCEQSLDGKDQFLTQFGNKERPTTDIVWHGHGVTEPATITELLAPATWSPSGTYLLIKVHELGVSLRGGPGLTKQKSFAHRDVTHFQFSPCERFLVTESCKKDHEGKVLEHMVNIWNVLTGEKNKFRGYGHLPSFNWSNDGSYFSRLNDGVVIIFESSTMSRIKNPVTKEPTYLKLHRKIKYHSWSPTDPYIVAYVGEDGNMPAHVFLIQIPTQKVLSQQSLVNVVDNPEHPLFFHWQEQGDYLAIKVDRHGKSKKKIFTAFEFFRIREKFIPVEALEPKDNVRAFAWEPNGDKFCILHAELNVTSRVNVSFYSMKGGKIRLIEMLEKKPINNIYWCPKGQYIVLAGLKAIQYQANILEFIDTNNLGDSNKEAILATEQHALCTQVAWDPTGRYVTSFVSQLKCKNENGYKIWSWRGVQLLSVNKDQLWQFSWRPRPPSLLSKKETDWLHTPKNYAKYARLYKEKDLQEQKKQEEIMKQLHDEKRKQYRAWLTQRRKEWKDDTEWRQSLGIVDDGEDEYYLVEEVVSEVLSQTTELLD